jgi:hypothetical protein
MVPDVNPSILRHNRSSARDDLVFKLTRSSATPPEREMAIQRAGAFGDAVKNVARRGKAVTLLSVRDEREMLSYVITPGEGSNSHVVTSLCSTLGAKATQIDAIDEHMPNFASAPYASFLIARPAKSASKETQSGGEQSEVAGHLSRIMQPGSWVAMTLRSPTKAEVRRVRRWFDHRRDGGAATHYTNSTNALTVTIFAGANTPEEVATLLHQAVSVIPGFDIEVTSFSPMRFDLRISIFVGIVAGIVGDLSTHRLLIGFAAGALGVIATIAMAKIPPSGVATSRSLRRARPDGFLPTPAHRWLWPRGPRRGTKQLSNGKSKAVNRAGGYPLAPSAFLFGPAMATGIVSPHAGNVSGVADTEYRNVPTALLDDVGPIIAYAERATPDSPQLPVHIDADEMFGGVGACGQPGTGKTTLLHNLWAWNTLERVRPSGRPGYPGENNVLIAFESKGDGAPIYENWSKRLGDGYFMIDVADPSTPALYIADPSLPPKERARMFVSAMKYAWAESAIQDLATETLTAILTAAMVCPPEVAATTAHLTDGEVTFMSLAHIMLGGGCTYADAKQFFNNLEEYHLQLPANHPDKATMGSSVSGLSSLFGADVSQSRWRDAVNSSRNKIDVLMAVPHWWSSSRPHGSWKQVLDSSAAVVVNSGVSRSGDLLNEEVGSVIASMTAYSLKIALQQNCSGWQDQGRYVSIFADEIAVLAKSSAEVIEWLRTQGRSYGVRPFLACQWPDQLPKDVHAAFMSFTTMFWFQQTNPTVIDDAVKRLSIGGGEWTTSDIGNLKKFHAIIHATAGGRLLSPAPVEMAYWTDERRFAHDQGYHLSDDQ